MKERIALCISCCMLLAGCTLFQKKSESYHAKTIQLPDTQAGKKMSAYLDTINSGKTEAMLQFITENFAPNTLKDFTAKDRARALTNIHMDCGCLDPVRIEKSSEEEIEILTYARGTEDWNTISLKLEPNAPYHVIDEMIRKAQPPSEFVGHGKMTESEIVGALEVYLDKLVKADLFSGAVLVAKDGKPIFSRAYGIANGACGMKNKLDTKFNLGSMNKMFTSVAIAQLVEQGKISYTDTIGKPLPDYPNKGVAAKVTVEHLVTHTSGLGDFFGKEYDDASKLRFMKITDHFPLFVNKPLEFKPGTKFRYSNAGFIVLGAIIEKISGQTYFDYVREHIYKPAGMINTDAYELDRDIPNLAMGYTRDENGVRRNNLFVHCVKGTSAGGGFSTVEDLFHFARALESGKLLTPEYVKLITTCKLKSSEPQNRRYAYGFDDIIVNGQRVYGHSGGFTGINSNLSIYPELGYIVAVMANYDSPAAWRVVEKIQEWITRK